MSSDAVGGDAVGSDAVGSDGQQPVEDRAGFWRGACEAAGIIAGFAVLGVALASGLAALQGAAWNARHADYPGPVVSPDSDRPVSGQLPQRVWLVDGYNVLCTGLLGGGDRRDWWSEPRRAALLARAAQLDPPDAEVWVAFDGAEPGAGDPAGRVRTVFASPADDWLLHEVKQRLSKASGVSVEVVVVTADRRLADRVRHRGGRVVTPKEFLGRCMS